MPQPGPGGPRNGSEPPPPAWQPRRPQYPPPQQQRPSYPEAQDPDGQDQQPRYAEPQYPEPQYEPQHQPAGPWLQEQYQQGQDHRGQDPGGGFRDLSTGPDYRSGGDYTMRVPREPYTSPVPPDPYGPDTYPQGPYASDPYAADRHAQDDYAIPGQDGGDEVPPGQNGRKSGPGPRRRRKRGRIRRFVRRPTVRAGLGLLLVFFCWVAFSLGQALTTSNGLSLSGKLAEWSRDHYLGSVVTLMEQWTYQPPAVGGKPKFSLAGPRGKLKFKQVHGFKPDVPKNLTPFATPALTGEGAWRLQETAHGQPALFTTFMRVDAVHTSDVAGIASFDQRLVKFQLHPGSQDPGSGFGGGQSSIPAGTRTGLLATFNGGFRLNASRGGFYLNGHTSGTLANGGASLVYYRNGTIKVGQWGRDVNMNSTVVGVRQNLQLIVDHGQVAANINQNVEANFGATLGGAYAVWRSGIGQTKDGRIVYVYGPALSAHSLASLLLRAGAVEGMELDINPFWTTFEYYQAHGHPADPAPVVLLPTQQTSAYRYYSTWARDFTAVYAK